MPTDDYFSNSYAQARATFRSAAEDVGAKLYAYEHPSLRGPDGGNLSTDVVFVGTNEASSCLLLISGTHGVEGFAGSGCQVGFFRDRLYKAFGKNTCAIVIHALNPYGFAWLRRVNEDNVDLNRNFQDFSRPLPRNENYDLIHDMLIPSDWDGEGRRAADNALQQFVMTQGLQALQNAVSSGQYTHSSGLFYGGSKTTWSVSILKEILTTHIPENVSRLVAIDIHTGLGPLGYGEPIFMGNDLRQYKRAIHPLRFGPEVRSLESGDSVSAVLTGTMDHALHNFTSLRDVTFLGLEFGTLAVGDVLTALRGDHWLHCAENIKSPLRDEIKRKIRDAFYVDASHWRAAVYGRLADFVIRASRVLEETQP